MPSRRSKVVVCVSLAALSWAAVFALASCSLVAPRTTEVIEPVQTEFLLAVLADLDRAITFVIGWFGL